MNCGMNATIIAYRKYNDIDIQFENNVIVTNRDYNNFKNGNIRYPGIKIKNNIKRAKSNA